MARQGVVPDVTTTTELLLVALVVALVTKRTRHPYTIALVIWGLLLGLLRLFEPAQLNKDLVLGVFLPPLLFEGALHLRSGLLKRRAGLIFGLALGGTFFTALLVGGSAYLLLGLPLATGLLLGAIVSPTDPVSVLATFRANRVDRELATIVEGESLFNDGVAVVLYVTLLEVLGGATLSPLQGLGGLALVVGGSVALGLGLGSLPALLLRRIGDHLIEVLLTVVTVYGTYLLAESLHLSGVLAVAVAGLVVGNHGLPKADSASRQSVVLFWEVVAFLVNSGLFLLIGFELRPDRFLGDLASAAVVFGVLLGARALLVYGAGALASWRKPSLPWRWQHVIFWGGLRGGVPVALALGLPPDLPGRDDLVAAVFGVVLLSLLGQGLTMPTLIRKLGVGQEEPKYPERGHAGRPGSAEPAVEESTRGAGHGGEGDDAPGAVRPTAFRAWGGEPCRTGAPGSHDPER